MCRAPSNPRRSCPGSWRCIWTERQVSRCWAMARWRRATPHSWRASRRRTVCGGAPLGARWTCPDATRTRCLTRLSRTTSPPTGRLQNSCCGRQGRGGPRARRSSHPSAFGGSRCTFTWRRPAPHSCSGQLDHCSPARTRSAHGPRHWPRRLSSCSRLKHGRESRPSRTARCSRRTQSLRGSHRHLRMPTAGACTARRRRSPQGAHCTAAARHSPAGDATC